MTCDQCFKIRINVKSVPWDKRVNIERLYDKNYIPSVASICRSDKQKSFRRDLCEPSTGTHTDLPVKFMTKTKLFFKMIVSGTQLFI